MLGAPNFFQPKGKDAKPSLIVGSYDFKLYAFDPVTGKKKWDYETSNYINGSPAVFSGRTAFGGCDALLHVIDLNAGKKQKQIDAEAYIIGSAAVAQLHTDPVFRADLRAAALEVKALREQGRTPDGTYCSLEIEALKQ